VRFHSILVDQPAGGAETGAPIEPAFFPDLNLDQVLEPMTAGREEYDLKPFFYAPLRDVSAVRYRHEVLRDLEKPPVLAAVEAFAEQLRSMREHLAQAERLHYQRQKQRWFLDAVGIYCDAVASLTAALTALEAGAEIASRGLRAFGAYLVAYVASDGFTALQGETRALQDALAGVRYAVHIKGGRVTVSGYGGEADYSAEVAETFAKFRQGAVKDYRVKLSDWADMNHVEARVLDLVARLYPAVFGGLEDYCARHRGYLDATIGAFDREVQFYLAYLGYIQRCKAAGLPFCYPQVSDRSKEVAAEAAFDLALAHKLTIARDGAAVVTNDFHLTGPERILVVTGPNQGGKTTFARMFGQLHYLAGLGLPIPARSARLFLPDQLFTHFEREEDLANLRGKLEDELIRVHDILGQASSQSLLIMNESFTATTLHDALLLGTAVLRQVIALGAVCVCVTFVDELASLGEATVSMVATVVPDNPAQRTFKIVRKPADGLAYAAAIANQYGLTSEALRRHIGNGSGSGSAGRVTG